MPDGPQSKQSASSDAERRSRRAVGAKEAGACALRVLEDPQGPMGCALLLRVQLKASAAAYLQQECWQKR